MRNVLLAVNRIQETTKLPRDFSSGGVTTMLYKDENDRPDGGSQGSEETKRLAVKKNNRFSHTGVGVMKAIEKVEKAKDSDFDRATHQRRSHLNEDDPVEGEQELLEKDTEMAPEREQSDRPSSLGLSLVHDPLPILARGRFADEEPEAA